MEWDNFLKKVSEDISHQDFITWFKPLYALIDASDEVAVKIIIIAPNSVISTYIKKNYLNLISKYFEENYQKPIKILIRVGDNPKNARLEGKTVSLSAFPSSVEKKENIQLVPINTDYTFENFVEGSSNKVALVSAEKIVSRLRSGKSIAEVLLFYGQSGLGKTHLLHAIANKLSMITGVKYALITTEMFYRQMINAIRSHMIEDFKEFFRKLDVLLLDDVQFFAGKTHSQEEVLHIYDNLLDRKKTVILTCDKYLKDTDIDKKNKLDERLRTRFCSGLSIGIEPPEFETRVQILMQKASQSGFELARGPAEIIAGAVKSNVRELEGALKLVATSAEIRKSKVDEVITREALRDLMEIGEKQISLDNIVRVVSEYFQVDTQDLLSNKRLKNLVYARQMGMYIAKELTDKSLADIGKYFGNRSHATVLHSVNKLKTQMTAGDVVVLGDYKAFKRRIYN